MHVPYTDVHAVLDSYYGRPEKTVHYSHVDCNGAEDKLTQCGKTTLSLTAGKTILKAADVAGVSCHGPPTTTPPCIAPPPLPPSPNCTNGEIQLVGGQTAAEGRLEYCYNGHAVVFFLHSTSNRGHFGLQGAGLYTVYM